MQFFWWLIGGAMCALIGNAVYLSGRWVIAVRQVRKLRKQSEEIAAEIFALHIRFKERERDMKHPDPSKDLATVKHETELQKKKDLPRADGHTNKAINDAVDDDTYVNRANERESN